MANNNDVDLEALFDQISSERVVESPKAEEPKLGANFSGPAVAGADTGADDPYDVFQRVGKLTRSLHDALRELGYDKDVENAMGALPDARARLTYIIEKTTSSAETTLTAVEHAQTLQDQIGSQSSQLRDRWEKLFAKQLSIDEFKTLAIDSRRFFNHAPTVSNQTSSHLLDIMMAQDFHDLTGQVVNRIVHVAETLEAQLVRLLLDCTPQEKREVVAQDGWLTGPAINTEERTDVVADQGQVDDLLASLGF
jgi:chemotaxis protein CheZ